MTPLTISLCMRSEYRLLSKSTAVPELLERSLGKQGVDSSDLGRDRPASSKQKASFPSPSTRYLN